MSYLVDTNVISEIIRTEPNTTVLKWFMAVPSQSLHISVLTLGEIRRGIEKISDPQKKQKLKIWLEHDLPEWFGDRIVTITKEVADKWGHLQGQTKRTLPTIDSLLAATALHFDFSLVTRNTKDFHGLSLDIINPFL